MTAIRVGGGQAVMQLQMTRALQQQQRAAAHSAYEAIAQARNLATGQQPEAGQQGQQPGQPPGKLDLRA
jgi:hypothetical protein